MPQHVRKTEGDCTIIDVRIVNIALLKGHERTDAQRLANLTSEIEADGILKKPIVVDANTNVVLDGHHRIGALRALGCSKIPAVLVDYQSHKIGVKTAENGEEYSKKKVVETALKGELLSPKSTWHYIVLSKKKTHISIIQNPVNVPLKVLRYIHV